MDLCNGRSKIIKLFEDKDIKSSNVPHNAKLELVVIVELIVEPELKLKDLEPEPLFEERISERTKIRRQKKSDEENQEGQVVKILTPDQMLSRLPITLAQLKAGNNSQRLKNEISFIFFVSLKENN